MLKNINEVKAVIMKEYKKVKVKELKETRINSAEKYVSSLFANH